VQEGEAHGTFDAWQAARGTGGDGGAQLTKAELVFGVKVAWRN
jgi:hypothetical protein